MTLHQPVSLADLPAAPLHKLAHDALGLARDIVDVAGYLEDADSHSGAGREMLTQAKRLAERVEEANGSVISAVGSVTKASTQTLKSVTESVAALRHSAGLTREVATWVGAVETRMSEIEATLAEVQKSNAEIASIAAQINILAINAKIEAARAGDSGRGFSVVADAINALSRKTAGAAEVISGAVSGLGNRITTLRSEAETVAITARDVMTQSDETDRMLGTMTHSVEATRASAEEIAARADEVGRAQTAFVPVFAQITAGFSETGAHLAEAAKRVSNLISVSETMVQNASALGGVSEDSALISFIRAQADAVAGLFESALGAGRISETDLFSDRYTPVAGSNPPQVMARFTPLTDTLLPPVIEAALSVDPRVVFCAAVDRNGYLPTHNRAFSKPQGGDSVWNAANCRNRRIFNDRVGLRAGRSTEPFVLQVYRRDMGGGQFILMKDLSAPIMVRGRHWGGLRMGYRL